jgi:hypothetical protein
MNVQLLGKDSKQFNFHAAGTLVVAMTDIDLFHKPNNAAGQKVQLAKGDAQWLADADATFHNLNDSPARFVLLALK